MQFNNDITRKVAEEAAKIMAEALKGNQHKIDANKNGKVDAHDFKLLRAQKEKEKANSMKHGKEVKEETELTESHFKVGDEVICKKSGMEGEVVKIDEPQVGKYYTVKQENGKMMKYAPDELKKEDEDEDEKEDKKEMKESAGVSKQKENKFHTKLDKLVHKTFGKSSDEKKMKEETKLDEALWPGTPEYEKKFPKDSKPGQRRQTQDYGYQGKEEEHGETTFRKEVKPAKRGKYGARQNFVRSRKISGKQLKDDVQFGFTDILEAYNTHGLKLIAAMIKEEPDNEQFTKEVEEQKKRDKGEIRNDKGVAKPLQTASVREEPVNPVREDIEQIDELSKGAYKNYLSASKKEVRKHMSGSQLSRYGDFAGPKQDREMNTKIAQKFANKKLKNEEVEQLDEIGSLLGGALGAVGAVAGGAGMAIHAAHKLASAAMGPKSSEGIQKGINDAKKAGDHKLYHSLKAHDHAQQAVKRAKAADEVKNDPASYHKTDNTKGKKGEMKSNAKMNYDTHVRASQEHAKQSKEYSAKEKSGAKISESTIDERTLSGPETAKKEEIVKSMKKNMQGFKERYGKRAKEVMYATATARAKENA